MDTVAQYLWIFQRVFDTINHDLSIAKLSAFGFDIDPSRPNPG